MGKGRGGGGVKGGEIVGVEGLDPLSGTDFEGVWHDLNIECCAGRRKGRCWITSLSWFCSDGGLGL